MGWLIALVALVLLGLLPVGIYAAYDRGGAVVSLIVGPFRLRLYPKRRSRAKQNKRSAAGSTAKDSSAANESRNAKAGTLSDFRAIVQLVFNFLSDFRRKLRIRNLELKIILAGDDPCDLSVNYGRAWTALGSVMPQLERLFVIKKRNLEIECDFTADEPLVEARIDMTITVCRLLWIIIYHAIPSLRKYHKIIKRVKGGATS